MSYWCSLGVEWINFISIILNGGNSFHKTSVLHDELGAGTDKIR